MIGDTRTNGRVDGGGCSFTTALAVGQRPEGERLARHPAPAPDARPTARTVADQVAACVLGQIHRAYPCASSQVLMSADQPLLRPRDTFCAFYGSFDWHSCVHSHWSLARLLAEDLLARDCALQATQALDETFDAEKIVHEAANWEHLPAHTELPYGMAWMLALDAELDRPAVRAAHPAWKDALAPLAEMAAGRIRTWVDDLRMPVRSGVHSDTAWSLAVAHDWACAQADGDLREAVEKRARAFYLRDIDAPCAYEPSGQTFTSPILNEAALMARVLPAGEYDDWMRGFLPQLFEPAAGENPGGPTEKPGWSAERSGVPAEKPSASAEKRGDPAEKPDVEPLLPDAAGTWDGSDYYGVHEVALPLARCAAARDACAALTDPCARTSLQVQADRWGNQGLGALNLQGYLADHWVGSFAVAVVAPSSEAASGAMHASAAEGVFG